jgi:hypothetical protein
MKYRIAMSISTRIQYMLQIKTFLFWKNYTISSCNGYGTNCHTPSFCSVEEANNYAIKLFGTNAKHVTTIISE